MRRPSRSRGRAPAFGCGVRAARLPGSSGERAGGSRVMWRLRTGTPGRPRREALLRAQLGQRCVNRLRDWRGIAARFGKTPDSYEAALPLCGAVRCSGSAASHRGHDPDSGQDLGPPPCLNRGVRRHGTACAISRGRHRPPRRPRRNALCGALARTTPRARLPRFLRAVVWIAAPSGSVSGASRWPPSPSAGPLAESPKRARPAFTRVPPAQAAYRLKVEPRRGPQMTSRAGSTASIAWCRRCSWGEGSTPSSSTSRTRSLR